MRIFIPRISWIGNWGNYLKSAFGQNNIDIITNKKEFSLNPIIHTFKLQQISKIKIWEEQFCLRNYNEHVLNECIAAKPDVFIVMNESRLYPTTINSIKEKCKCMMVCILADNPWDSSRYIADFPHSLKFFDIIFTGEPTYNINIQRVAPKAKIFLNFGGFDPDYFYPVNEQKLTKAEIEHFKCDVSFTGTSYGPKAEGAYRSDILSYLTDFNLKIWGDSDWPYRFKYLPSLASSYKGERLSYDNLRKLYHLSIINLNIPNPQVYTGFQPRVFEIAACKGFQIADHRSLLREIFSEDELVTFQTIDELREKILFYKNNDLERNRISENLYNKVIKNFTWTAWAEKIMKVILEHGN